MILVFKIILVFFLAIPVTALTCIVWVFGGWTKGWDYMPNPLHSLFSWIDK